MKPIEKIVLSLGFIAFMIFLVTNPFNWTTDDGQPATISPLVWILFSITLYLFIRLIVVSYKELSSSRPKRTYVRHSRSHYNTTRKGK